VRIEQAGRIIVRIFNTFVCVSLALIVAASAYVNAQILHCSDVVWLLQVAKQAMHGGHYVTDFHETNPPLILYIYMIPAWVAEHLNINSYAAAAIEVYCLVAISLLLVGRYAKDIFSENINHARIFIVLLACLFVLVPINFFMQRENICTILAMPYLLLVALRLKKIEPGSRAITILVGALAGVAFAIKPQFVIVPICIEVVAKLCSRFKLSFFRSETWSMFAVFVCYAISVLVFFPEYIKFFVQVVLPYYPYYGQDEIIILFLVPLVFLLSSGLVYLAHASNKYDKLAIVLVAAGLGFVIENLITDKPWLYHYYPILVYSMLLFMIAVWRQIDIANSFRSRLFDSLISLMVAGIMLAYTVSFFVSEYEFVMTQRTLSFFTTPEKYFSEHTPKSVYFFTGHVVLFVTLNSDKTTIANSLSVPFLLPYITLYKGFSNPTAKQQAKYRFAVKYYRDTVVNVFRTRPPDSVVVINVPKADAVSSGYGFNFLQFFKKDPRFAKLWSNYRLVTTKKIKERNQLMYFYQLKGS
jgi:hypothetical protein